MEKKKNFILQLLIKKIEIIIILFLILLTSTFIFLRYTGILNPIFWYWKTPQIALIENSNTIGYSQNNDQLWLDINFNSHHSNVKTANVWVTNNETSVNSKKQVLTEGSNTYIFKNLDTEEGKNDYTVKYQIEWSIWGEESGTLAYIKMQETPKINFVSMDTTTTNSTVQMHRVGQFATFADLGLKNTTSTSGYYLINKNSPYFNKFTKVEEKNKVLIKFNDLLNRNINEQKYFYNEYRTSINNLFVYNGEIPEGDSTKTFTEIHTSNINYSQVSPLSTSDNYLMVGAGIATDPINNKLFLNFTKPFVLNIYGTPTIEGFSATSNYDGDIILTDANVIDNNYDKSMGAYMQYRIYNGDTLVDSAFVPYSKGNPDFSYTFFGILKDEAFFNEETGDTINYTVEAEMWYGSYLTPEYSSETNNNYDNFLHSENISIYDGSINRIVTNTPQYRGIVLTQFYYLDTTGHFDIFGFVVDTGRAYWSNDNPNLSDPTIEVQWKMNDSEYVLCDSYEFTYDSLVSEDYYWFDNVGPNGEQINIGDVLTFRILMQTPEYDWWGNPTGNTVTTVQYFDPIVFAFPTN